MSSPQRVDPPHSIQYCDPRSLKVAPEVASFNSFDDDDPLVQKFVADLKDGDIFPHIFLGPTGVVAGLHRLRAHQLAHLPIAVVRVSAEKAELIAMKENSCRSDLSKEQQAFRCAPLITKIVERAEQRQLANLKAGTASREWNNSTHGENGANPATLGALADEINIDRKTVSNAKMTYEELVKWDEANEPKKWGDSKQKQTALDYFSARILDRESPMGLGAVRAGLAGKQATDEGKRKRRSVGEMITAPLVTVITQLGEIGPIRDLEDEKKKDLRDYLTHQFLEVRKYDAPKCEQAAAALREAAAEFERLAKKAGKEETN